jgi:23S rRNA (cytosine1962-C5)-methyltransferase
MNDARLKAREDRRLRRGHPWAFRNEFESLPDLEDGTLVRVVSDRNQLVGIGFFQREGGIAVRLLTRDGRNPDADWIAETIKHALTLRERLFPGERVYRWVFGESDGLPGLVIDRYGAVVAVRSQSPFHDQRREDYTKALLSTDDVEGVYWLDASGAAHETGSIASTADCTVNGFQVAVDLVGGQKTGLFLDQRANWPLTVPWSPEARVLDGHCYAGLWSLHAARAGAASVLGVDTSQSAVEYARRNAERNGLESTCRFECADIQEVLGRGDTYNLIVLDPPALAKSRKTVAKALGLYQALNRDALKALAPGGILITSTCSQPIDAGTFLESLKRAATSAQRPVKLLGIHGASPDHPVLLSMPETHYLTCAVLYAD